MKHSGFFIILLIVAYFSNAQKSLLEYDECRDEISKNAQKKYEKAVQLFQDRHYQKCSVVLNEIIKENEDFASPYFLMGMIGVVKNNTRMIEKYFPMVKERCENFTHPYLYYYLGLIDYTEEHYEQASKDFEEFLSLTDGDNFYDSLQNVAINYIDWSDFLSKTLENRVPFNPQNINFLSKNKNYYEPFITWDTQQIFFIREEITRDTNTDSFTADVTIRKNRYLEKSELDSTGFYDRGFILNEPFNLTFPQSGVSVTTDNNFIYFSKRDNTAEDNTWNIYVCENTDGYFSQAKTLNINTTMYDEFSPTVSADGNTLYFVSNREGGKGSYDIWFSHKTGKNTWSEPQNMGRDVNTFADETYPFVSADNSCLYFLSNGRKTIGGTDIFCYNIKEQKPAINLGYPINTEGNERSIGVMIDGKTAYGTFFNSDSTYLNLQTFVLPDNVRTKPMKIVNGRMQKTLDGDISLTMYNVNTQKTTAYYIADEHPNFSLVVEDKQDYIVYLNQAGYMFFATRINAQTEDLIIYQKPLEYGQQMQLDNIVYNPNNGGFDELSSLILDDFVTYLKKNQRLRFTLSAPKNILQPLYSYLIKSGIRKDRIEIQNTNTQDIIYTIK